MRKQVAFLMALVFIGNSLHMNENHDASNLKAGTVSLIADNGQYLAVCVNCANGNFTESASFVSAPQQWTLEIIGTKVAFKGTNGKYLSRCSSCWNSASYRDAAFVHQTSPSGSYSQWTPQLQPNGKYAFKSDNGKYLDRCEGCVDGTPNPNFAFVNQLNPTGSWAQWTVVYTNAPNMPSLGVRTIQADNGDYLKYCPNCGTANAVSISSGNDANAKWNVQQIAGTNKVAFKGANGKYLSRCNNCWMGTNLEPAMVSSSNTIGSYSQWYPIWQSNGRWAFQADSGKYLARCNGCARSTSPNLAFIHISNASDPVAQWKLT